MKFLARFLARPAVADWLIRRAIRTPYFHLVDAEGSVYMERYWLFNPYPPKSDGADRRWGNWLPSVRLHKIMREGRDRHMHDHPWNARTVILCGWYEEQRPITDGYVSARRKAGDTASLKFGQYHRISRVSYGGVWTLFITWRHRGTWGFLVDGKKVPWREYLADEEAGLPLTFAEFRRANVARCIKWHPDGIESWSPSDWLTAITGELGELASLLKMRNRERDGLPGNKFSPTQKQIADEVADVLTYLDLLAEVLGVDLASAAIAKFNEVSERVGFPDRLPTDTPAPNGAGGQHG